MLEEIWLGGRVSPQYGFPSMGEVFEPPSKILNESLEFFITIQILQRVEKMSEAEVSYPQEEP